LELFVFSKEKIMFLDVQTLLVGLLYLVLSGLYLVIFPGLLYLYLQKRWYVASSVERFIMYFFVFFFFPGMLLLSPFLNLNPKRREVKA
jgi:NAD(P)H-quinone oxidoreductase subunit L